MKKRPTLLPLLVLGMHSAFAQGPPAFEREILGTGSGLTAVPLDRHVYEAAREDLEDLRVRDGRGGAVAFVLERNGGEETLSPRWSRAFDDDPGETLLTVELGARHQPFAGFVLDVEDQGFRREVRVEAREEPVIRRTDVVAPRATWRSVGEGVVFRRGGQGEESLRVDVAGRARVVRLRLLDRDDRPLRVSGVAVAVPRERLLFEAEDGASYTLTYGAPLGGTSPDPGRVTGGDAGAAQVAALGPPVRRDVEADVLPWSERHPTLMWVGLLVVAGVLGTVVWQALRASRL